MPCPNSGDMASPLPPNPKSSDDDQSFVLNKDTNAEAVAAAVHTDIVLSVDGSNDSTDNAPLDFKLV